MSVNPCGQVWDVVPTGRPPAWPADVRLRARFDEPPREPGLLAEPALGRWPEVARRNRRLLLDGRVEVAGLPLVHLRACLREEFPGLPLPVEPQDPLVFVAGHQPVLYHPGVWVKLFAGERVAAASGGHLINLVVDSDVSDLAVPLPALRPGGEGSGAGGPLRLGPPGAGPSDEPLESRPAPTAAAWAEFLAEVRSCLLPSAPEAAARLERLESILPAPGETVAAFFSRLRRAWEARAPVPGPTRYQEVPISSLSESLAFRLWVVEWAEGAAFWRQAYNEALRQYRVMHRLRYPANPFPDLEEGPEGIEIPFWSLREAGGRTLRAPVLVQIEEGRAGRLVLRAAEPGGVRTLARLPAGRPLEAARALAEAGVSLRPKAIPLSLWARLLLGDLFIHGTGGARYETIGDFLLEARWPRAFGREVPSYATCSATLRLEIRGAKEQACRRARLEELVRSLEHNPQRVVAELEGPLGREAAQAGVEPDAGLKELAARKEELVRQIQAGGDRKALGRAIREVNGELSRRLSPLARYLHSQLEGARRAEALVTERGYPFFLFEPGELWQLLPDVPAPGAGSRG